MVKQTVNAKNLPPFTMKEHNTGINMMKNSKAAGVDDICFEQIIIIASIVFILQESDFFLKFTKKETENTRRKLSTV